MHSKMKEVKIKLIKVNEDQFNKILIKENKINKR